MTFPLKLGIIYYLVLDYNTHSFGTQNVTEGGQRRLQIESFSVSDQF